MTHEQAIESIVSQFEAALKPIVAQARRAVIEALTKRLSVTNGMIARTKTNQRILRTVRDLFEREMKRAGYQELVDRYVQQFNGQFKFFNDHLTDLGKQIGQDLSVKFGPRDLDYFAAQQSNTAHLLDVTVEQIAADAQRQAILSVGGLKLSDLISEIAEQFDKSVGEATTLADTAVSTFYRVISDRGYQIIERDIPGFDVRYEYEGPDDVVTRPFCDALLKKGISYTRVEIDRMENGQIPGVFTSCGGFNCRHQWMISLNANGN